MGELKEGDSVLAIDTTGELVYSQIILSLHQAPKKRAEFYKIRTDKGHSLTVTPSHLLYVSNDQKDQSFPIQFNTIRTRFAACLLYTSPSPRDATLSRMPSSA